MPCRLASFCVVAVSLPSTIKAMKYKLDDRTSATLLLKLKQSDNLDWNDAWVTFFNRYSPMIFVWCKKWGLQDADAEDVSANVLSILGRRMQSFEYDPTHFFRGWLKTVVENEIKAVLLRRTKRKGDYGQGSSGDSDSILLEQTDPGLAAAELAEEIESQRIRLQKAMQLVEKRVQNNTWQAFHKTAVEGLPVTDVAQSLGMTVVAVYKARSRVQELLREVAKEVSDDSPSE